MDSFRKLFHMRQKPTLEARINNHTQTADQSTAASCQRVAELKLLAQDASRRGNKQLVRQYCAMIAQEEQHLKLLTASVAAVYSSKQTLATTKAMNSSVKLTEETVHEIKKTGVPKIAKVNRIGDQLQDIRQDLNEVGETFDGLNQLTADEEDHVDEMVDRIEKEQELSTNSELANLPSLSATVQTKNGQNPGVKTDALVLNEFSGLFPDSGAPLQSDVQNGSSPAVSNGQPKNWPNNRGGAMMPTYLDLPAKPQSTSSSTNNGYNSHNSYVPTSVEFPSPPTTTTTTRTITPLETTPSVSNSASFFADLGFS